MHAHIRTYMYVHAHKLYVRITYYITVLYCDIIISYTILYLLKAFLYPKFIVAKNNGHLVSSASICIITVNDEEK